MLASIEEDQTPALASMGAASTSTASLLSEEQTGAIIPKHNLPRKSSSEEVFTPKAGAAVVKKKEGPHSDESSVGGAPRRKMIKIQTNHDTEEKKLGMRMNMEEVGLVPVPAPVSSSASSSNSTTMLNPQFTQSIVRRANTNYIYCSEPQNVFASEGTQIPPLRRDEQGQTLISLLMPASNLNATFGGSGFGEEEGHALLEITCQIMNINVYPSIPLTSTSNNTQTVS
jgi:hypothetical protein